MSILKIPLSFVQTILDKIRYRFFVTENKRLKEIGEIIKMIEDGEIYHNFSKNQEFVRKITRIKMRLRGDSAIAIIDSLLDETSRQSVIFLKNRDSINLLSTELTKELE